MALCTECGTSVSDGIQFCTSCGARMEQGTQAADPVRPPQAAQAPAASAPAESGTVMSTGAYVGLILLFSLPVIGWIFCLILAFAGKNQNRKNFAKAMLIFMIIGLILAVVAYFVSGRILQTAQEYFMAQDFYSLIG